MVERLKSGLFVALTLAVVSAVGLVGFVLGLALVGLAERFTPAWAWSPGVVLLPWVLGLVAWGSAAGAVALWWFVGRVHRGKWRRAAA